MIETGAASYPYNTHMRSTACNWQCIYNTQAWTAAIVVGALGLAVCAFFDFIDFLPFFDDFIATAASIWLFTLRVPGVAFIAPRLTIGFVTFVVAAFFVFFIAMAHASLRTDHNLDRYETTMNWTHVNYTMHHIITSSKHDRTTIETHNESCNGTTHRAQITKMRDNIMSSLCQVCVNIGTKLTIVIVEFWSN